VGPGLKVLGQRTSDEDYSNILPSLKRPHVDYLHDFYADTAMFGGGVPATRCGLEFFGAGQVVFATDTPLGPIAPTIKTVRGLGLPGSAEPKLLSRNEVDSAAPRTRRWRSRGRGSPNAGKHEIAHQRARPPADARRPYHLAQAR